MAEFHPLPPVSADDSTSASWKALNRTAEERARSCETAVMPSLDHLRLADYQHVYEPSDDTFLLLDGLLAIIMMMMERSNPEEQKIHCTLEIGCGTGVPTVFLAKELMKLYRRKAATSSHPASSSVLWNVVTDINPRALQVARDTAAANGVDTLEAVQCDLASALLPRLEGVVDIIVFNPPYVPTPDDEVGSRGIEASWAGGHNGRVVVDRVVVPIARLLRHPSGTAYLVTVDDNLPEELAGRFRALGLDMRPWVRRRARNEFLTLQRISWLDASNELKVS